VTPEGPPQATFGASKDNTPYQNQNTPPPQQWRGRVLLHERHTYGLASTGLIAFDIAGNVPVRATAYPLP